MAQAAVKTQTTPAPFPADQFERLRQTIDDLENQSKQGAQRGEGANRAARPAARSRKGQRSMSDTSQAQAAPNAAPNALTLAQMLVIAGELGAQEALGRDGQVKFDLKVAEAAFVGAVDLTKDKHGQGVDDAAKLAEAYAKGRNSTVIFDHKELKQRKLMSNVRTMIKIGSSPKFGVGEPMQTINNLMTVRQNLRRTATKGLKIDDAHNTLMRYAREQLKRDVLIPDAELKDFCVRSEADPRTAEEVIRSVQKTISNLMKGKIANCPEVDNSPEMSTIMNACNRRLSAIAKAKNAEAA